MSQAANPVRIVVTGGYGFYGRHLLPALKEQLPNCLIFVLDIIPPTAVGPELTSHVTQSFTVDITSADEVRQAVSWINPDAIVHTAGINPPLSERYHRRIEKQVKSVNVGGTKNLLNAAVESGCKAFIYTSSCCVVTDNLRGYFANIDERWISSSKLLVYGESKSEAEQAVLTADSEEMATCVLRPSVTCGEGDYILIPSVHACIAKGETPFRLGDGMNLWDVVYVGNVAYAHALAVQNLLSTRSAHGEAMVSP
ncbi:uncharacterized protein HMPREF1541_06408 [Cyphellophora europaea CBS 101466]|uniref:3-beta hydroxysteroid dehydrogenase/isomerase domain-containing protein n=1 Tax=Cyphellophora europaea (strain CBS 101466) TaxID=1220924 RepID=W2RRN0_CYPE1|nr:uncharacterized protein HMPREF1541_06408 [Cyphellophora europaea CBS 101466]ETN38373.1 hypothetical protein HMPREF1541_06408 [Cyphellophora europaea CBS 101466]